MRVLITLNPDGTRDIRIKKTRAGEKHVKPRKGVPETLVAETLAEMVGQVRGEIPLSNPGA